MLDFRSLKGSILAIDVDISSESPKKETFSFLLFSKALFECLGERLRAGLGSGYSEGQDEAFRDGFEMGQRYECR